MINLTINGLKDALNYIQENSRSIKFNSDGSKKDLIITPESMSEEDAYHLRVIQLLTPKLITRLAEDYTVLSLDGQELFDVLNDDQYINSLTDKLKLQGYSDPSDRQVFRLLKENMAILPITNSAQLPPLSEVFGSFFDAAMTAKAKNSQPADPAPELITAIEPEVDLSEAAKIIDKTKKEKVRA